MQSSGDCPWRTCKLTGDRRPQCENKDVLADLNKMVRAGYSQTQLGMGGYFPLHCNHVRSRCSSVSAVAVKSRLKRRARIFLKGCKTWLQGYPPHYASRTTSPQRSSHFCHQVLEACVPIPDKGTLEVRANRLVNLKIAIERLNGLTILPGQILAFWHHVPAPTERNGYRRGPAFIHGRVQTDVGGGLCLIATNLFVVLLHSGFEILERHGHSIDPYGDKRFFRLGEDAAVAYGFKDLIVRNRYDLPLYLAMELDRERNCVRTQLWGKTPFDREVSVKSSVLRELPATNDAGISGWHVRTHRTIVKLSHDLHRESSLLDSSLHPNGAEAFTYETVYKPC